MQQLELVLRVLGAEAHDLLGEAVGGPRLERLRAEAAAARHQARDWTTLRAEVHRWQAAASLGWSDADVVPWPKATSCSGVECTCSSPASAASMFKVIGSPSSMGIDAALTPADVNYLYFVARGDAIQIARAARIGRWTSRTALTVVTRMAPAVVRGRAAGDVQDRRVQAAVPPAVPTADCGPGSLPET